MLESKFKTELIRDIENLFPGCMVLHLDANELQGIPDLIILYESKWAVLEGKKNKNAPRQPNQDYYVYKMNEMSFASFIYPENKGDVLHELQQAFRSNRSTRFSKS